MPSRFSPEEFSVKTSQKNQDQNRSQEILQKVQSALMQVHRNLIGSLKSDREQILGHSISPVDWLQMMITQAEYAWLKTLSGLMADFDALIDNHEVTEKELQIAQQELGKLFLRSSIHADDFHSKYTQALRRDSELMLYHGQLRHLILNLPAAANLAASPDIDSTQTRLAWHQKPRPRS